MSYNKNIWKRKDRITKEKLNHMEDGIHDAHDKIKGAINDLSSQIKDIKSKTSDNIIICKKSNEDDNTNDLQSCIEHEKCLYASDERLEVSYLEKLYKEKYSDLSTIGDNILDNSEKERVDTFLKTF